MGEPEKKDEAKKTGTVSEVGTGKNLGGRPSNEAKAARLIDEAKKLGWKEPEPVKIPVAPSQEQIQKAGTTTILPPLTPADQEACRKAGKRWWEIIEAFLPAFGKEWIMKKIKDEETKAVIVDESKDFSEAVQQFFIDRRWTWVPGTVWLIAISVRYFVFRWQQVKAIWAKFFPEKKKDEKTTQQAGGGDGKPKNN